jgi:hypothetical protein
MRARFPKGCSSRTAGGVHWGLLASEGRFRLFPATTPVGAATGRYLELYITETDEDDWPYVGLLALESLLPVGLLERLLDESATMRNELRQNVGRCFLGSDPLTICSLVAYEMAP